MTDKELIKQELERRINLIQDTNVTSYADGWIQAYKELLQFIDSLPEEPASGDLDFQTFAKEMDAVFALPSSETENTEENPLNWEYAIARHFAEWQKQQMKEALQTEYEKGRFDMREEMMKMAEDTAGLSLSWREDSKVKIIIIEED